MKSILKIDVVSDDMSDEDLLKGLTQSRFRSHFMTSDEEGEDAFFDDCSNENVLNYIGPNSFKENDLIEKGQLYVVDYVECKTETFISKDNENANESHAKSANSKGNNIMTLDNGRPIPKKPVCRRNEPFICHLKSL